MASLLKIFFCLSLFVGLGPGCFAQQDSLRVEEEAFYTYPSKFALRLVYQERKLPLLLEPLAGVGRAVYEPNSGRTLGVGGALLGVSYTFSFLLPEALQRDTDRFGNTNQRDFRFSAFYNRFGLQLDRQDYEGYYLNNAAELDPSRQQGSNFPYREDLRVKRVGIGLSFLLQPENFSYSAALNNRKRQRQGGGTFFVQVYGGWLWVGGDSLLLPRPYFAEAGPAGLVERLDVYHASLMPGYAHTFVVGRFYLMASLALGPEVQKKNVREEVVAGGGDTWKEQWAAEGRLQLQAAFGYDDNRYFCNLAYTSQRQQYEVDGLGVSVNTNGFRLLLGRRFQELGFMNKIRQWGIYRRLRGGDK